jgi:hypothetical protein
MNYSVHFCLGNEEIFQIYDAPIPRVGDHLSMEADTFRVRTVTHAWHRGRAGKPYLYITVALEMKVEVDDV